MWSVRDYPTSDCAMNARLVSSNIMLIIEEEAVKLYIAEERTVQKCLCPIVYIQTIGGKVSYN